MKQLSQLDKRILSGVAIFSAIGISLQIYNAYNFKKIKDNIVNN